jgi:hypothetical protein
VNGEELSPAAVERRLRLPREYAAALADASFVFTCMQNCPEPSRAAVYGRMVLELSIRRRVAADAVALRQRAWRSTTSDQLNRTFAVVDSARRGVERLHQREALAAGSHSPTPLRAAELKPLRRSLVGDEFPLEKRTIRSLADQPAALTTVMRWLKPSDFANDECAGFYSELTVMHNAKTPIDPITLAWRGRRVGLSGAMADSLLASRGAEEVAADPIGLSRQLLERSVQAALLTTADALEALAQPNGENATSIAYARLNSLWPQQRRLVKAKLMPE